MNRQEFIEVVSKYKGDITSNDTSVFIEAYNDILDTRNEEMLDGTIRQRNKIKRVKCIIGLDLLDNRLYGEEDTLELIGGFSYPAPTIEQLKYALERYNFKSKDYSFISLFDDIESIYN